jgi:hypothetical protein
LNLKNIFNSNELEERLNRFLSLMDREILIDAGRVTAELAKQHVESEFEKYRIIQDQLYVSDFDKFLLLEEEVNEK